MSDAYAALSREAVAKREARGSLGIQQQKQITTLFPTCLTCHAGENVGAGDARDAGDAVDAADAGYAGDVGTPGTPGTPGGDAGDAGDAGSACRPLSGGTGQKTRACQGCNGTKSCVRARPHGFQAGSRSKGQRASLWKGHAARERKGGHWSQASIHSSCYEPYPFDLQFCVVDAIYFSWDEMADKFGATAEKIGDYSVATVQGKPPASVAADLRAQGEMAPPSQAPIKPKAKAGKGS